MASPTSNADRTGTEIEHVPQLTNHWWWRPGWRAGRHYYACHITFEDQPEVRGLVDTYQQALGSVAGLDLIPPNWLHLTMQGIGFRDEIDADELARVTDTIRQELDGYPPLRATFHRPVVRPEALYLPAEPADAIRRLRADVRSGIGKALGIDRVRGTDDEVRQYRPHVSIAYVNTDQASTAVVEALRRADADPVTIVIRQVSVLEFHRDDRMYEWTRSTPVPLAS